MRPPRDIIETMLSSDAFSKWLNISVEQIGYGYCTLTCKTTSQMVNGFDILHGGITYSLSDSALAFASNSYGYKCVSIETSISHLRTVNSNELLTVKCYEVHRGKTIAIYNVEIFNEQNKIVSQFKGTVNISQEIW